MEIVIVICLLIIITLLLEDKIVIKNKKTFDKKLSQEKNKPNLPDIMGQPKPLRSLLLPKSAKESKKKKQEKKSNNFDVEINDQDIEIPIPQEDVVSNEPDFEEEEEEWNSYGVSGGNDGLAQGVTFEELSAMGMLLQKDNLEPSQKETAVAIIQKIQGTELFTLLENSVESASRKIAELIDRSLSSEAKKDSSSLRKKEFEDFDIRRFL